MWLSSHHPPHHTQTSMDSCTLPFPQFKDHECQVIILNVFLYYDIFLFISLWVCGCPVSILIINFHPSHHKTLSLSLLSMFSSSVPILLITQDIIVFLHWFVAVSILFTTQNKASTSTITAPSSASPAAKTLILVVFLGRWMLSFHPHCTQNRR